MPSNVKLFFEKISPFIEYIYSFCGAFIVFLCLFFFRDTIILKLDQDQIQLTNLGLAVFSWLALQVGFSFGVYAFVMSKTDGFMGEIKDTPAMNRFRNFLTHGYYTGMGISFFTLAFIVIESDLYTSSLFYYILFALWFSSFVYSICCFIYTIRIFQHIQKFEDKKAQETP